MSITAERPTNGHALTISSSRLDEPDTDQPTSTGHTNSDPVPPPDSPRVRELRETLSERQAEAHYAAEIVQVDAETQADAVRTDREREQDRQVHQEIRAKQRAETRRAGFAAVRRARWGRFQARLDEMAERTRERLLDPARTLGTDYRRWMVTSVILFSLLAGAAAFMARTVHHGVVGMTGTWLGYLIEPLASLVLVLSMIAQYTARQRGISIPRTFIALDGALALASLVLMTVPWGLRYGWDGSTLLSHSLLPLLMVLCVTVWHMASGIYSQSIANTRHDPALAERLALLRTAVATGALPPNPSINQVIKYLRAQLGGIGHRVARETARCFLGH